MRWIKDQNSSNTFLLFSSFLCNYFREAFKTFDRNKDGFISMKELKKVTNMLGTMLTKEEVEEFMAEADLASLNCRFKIDIFEKISNRGKFD